jgi:hypothetical protein
MLPIYRERTRAIVDIQPEGSATTTTITTTAAEATTARSDAITMTRTTLMTRAGPGSTTGTAGGPRATAGVTADPVSTGRRAAASAAAKAVEPGAATFAPRSSRCSPKSRCTATR